MSSVHHPTQSYPYQTSAQLHSTDAILPERPRIYYGAAFFVTLHPVSRAGRVARRAGVGPGGHRAGDGPEDKRRAGRRAKRAARRAGVGPGGHRAGDGPEDKRRAGRRAKRAARRPGGRADGRPGGSAGGCRAGRASSGRRPGGRA